MNVEEHIFLLKKDYTFKENEWKKEKALYV